MTHTNRSRVILGGLLAGVVINVVEYLVNGLLMKDAWSRAMQGQWFTTGAILMFVVCGFLLGIASVWLYAAIRPRYGAGPNTAIRAGVVAWAIGSFIPSLSSYPMGFFPIGLLAISTVIALVEIVLGTMAGARLYKEELMVVAPTRPAAAA